MHWLPKFSQLAHIKGNTSNMYLTCLTVSLLYTSQLPVADAACSPYSYVNGQNGMLKHIPKYSDSNSLYCTYRTSWLAYQLSNPLCRKCPVSHWFWTVYHKQGDELVTISTHPLWGWSLQDVHQKHWTHCTGYIWGRRLHTYPHCHSRKLNR